jgi:hypothetical protein
MLSNSVSLSGWASQLARWLATKVTVMMPELGSCCFVTCNSKSPKQVAYDPSRLDVVCCSTFSTRCTASSAVVSK